MCKISNFYLIHEILTCFLVSKFGDHFSDITDLYRLDRRLRSVMVNAIEKIEMAVRTKIVQVYA